MLFFLDVVGDCPDGFVNHGESCYHFSHDMETWVDAVVWSYFHDNIDLPNTPASFVLTSGLL